MTAGRDTDRRPSDRRVRLARTAAVALLSAGSALGSQCAPASAAVLGALPALSDLASRPLGSTFGPAAGSASAAARARSTLSRAPLAFEANRGQTDDAVRFLARGPRSSVLLTPAAAVLRLAAPAGGRGGARSSGGDARTLRLRFVGANPSPRIAGDERLATVTNYLLGDDPSRWRRGVPTFKRVRYEALWPGVDAVFYGNGEHLEYDFVVAPHANPDAIGLAVSGARRMRVDRRGDLVLDVGGTIVRQRRPVAFQTIGAKRVRVPCAYDLSQRGRVTLRLGAYDATRPLVVDPVVAFSTLLFPYSGQAASYGIAADAEGGSYVTGHTLTDLTLPSGPINPDFDGFVVKLNAAGTEVDYVTYFGGLLDDLANDIAVDAAGSAYITGVTLSADFPTTADAFQQNPRGDGDAFVTKLDASGGLAYSTYLGGPTYDRATAIALDASRNAYVTGGAGGDFPHASGAPGTHGAFAAKLGANGTTLHYARYLGSTDGGTAIAVDSQGRAYVAGVAKAPGLATPGAYQTRFAGGEDAFVTRLDASGASASYQTYLGGSGVDEVVGIEVDATGAAYVAGTTRSSDFPTAEPIQTAVSAPEKRDAFVAKLAPAGDALVYSTYLAGSDEDWAWGLAVDATGAAFVAGTTHSADFPAVKPFDLADPTAGYLAQVAPDGRRLVFSTKLEANPSDVAVDGAGYAYISGYTNLRVVKLPADVEPPETEIESGPPTVSMVNTASFEFSTSEPGPGATFECQLDSGPFAACASPRHYAVLPDGTHTFRVRAIDKARNVGTAATYPWEVRADPPDTMIDPLPPDVTNGSASFHFTSSRPGSTFECRRDQAAAYAPCSTPARYASLTGGTHTFRVRATDAAGQTDVTAATFTWHVDLLPPDTSISRKPPRMSSESMATFGFESSDDDALLECRLDGAGFAPCTSPLTLTGLGDRDHTFSVRSTDAVGNVDESPAEYRWNVEWSRPDTAIVSAPAPVTRSATAVVTITASEWATFECQLDAQPFVACASPATFTGLAEGTHKLAVRAVDGVGKVDPTPATVEWTVDLTAPAAFELASPADGAANLAVSPEFSWATTSGRHHPGRQLRAVDRRAARSHRGAVGLRRPVHRDAVAPVRRWRASVAGACDRRRRQRAGRARAVAHHRRHAARAVSHRGAGRRRRDPERASGRVMARNVGRGSGRGALRRARRRGVGGRDRAAGDVARAADRARGGRPQLAGRRPRHKRQRACDRARALHRRPDGPRGAVHRRAQPGAGRSRRGVRRSGLDRRGLGRRALRMGPRRRRHLRTRQRRDPERDPQLSGAGNVRARAARDRPGGAQRGRADEPAHQLECERAAHGGHHDQRRRRVHERPERRRQRGVAELRLGAALVQRRGLPDAADVPARRPDAVEAQLDRLRRLPQDRACAVRPRGDRQRNVRRRHHPGPASADRDRRAAAGDQGLGCTAPAGARTRPRPRRDPQRAGHEQPR